MFNANNAHRDKQGGSTTDREHFYKLCALEIEENLKASLCADVEKDQLESLSCVQLENIEVDSKHDGRTGAATYFQPSQPINEGLKQILSRHWFKLGPGQAQRIYPEYKAGWFAGPWDEADMLESDELEIDRFGGTAWRCMEDRRYVRDTTSLILPRGYIFYRPGAHIHAHEYFCDFAFFPKDDKKPHLACIIGDTFVSPDKILRSEIHGAIALIMYQLARKRFGDHRIKPVMLYTVQKDQYARITQAYYDPDMGKIVIRQSRQLDLRGTEPTEDAWLLMRWILNTPVGDTLVKSEDAGLPVRAKEPAASPLKPTTGNIARRPKKEKLEGSPRSSHLHGE